MNPWPLLADTRAQLLTLAPEDEVKARANYIQQIRQFAKADLSPEDVHIRGVRLINTKPATFYGRFTPESVAESAELIAGRPVMIGHDYDRAPIGRFFAARRVFLQDTPKSPRKESYWLEALFYMPKDAEGDAAVRRIDLGIWSEWSMAWMFSSASCSLCKNDIRTMACPHVPGEVYDDGLCVFEMSGILEVMEGSVVYMGAERGTHSFKAASASSRLTLEAARREHGGVLHASALAEMKLADEAARATEKASGVESLLAAPDSRPVPLRAAVASVLLGKDRFDSDGEAKLWARQHGFRADKVEDAGDAYRAKQFDPRGEYEQRNVTIADGVRAVVVRAKSAGEARASVSSLFTS